MKHHGWSIKRAQVELGRWRRIDPLWGGVLSSSSAGDGGVSCGGVMVC